MLYLVLALALSGADFNYDAEGRRDPFVRQDHPSQKRSLTQDVRLTGIARTPDGTVALLEGPDGRTRFLGVGARIADGTIASIDADGVVFRMDDGSEVRLAMSR